ncbi:MAG: ABC transporter substrate-binding protein, partial [Clostridia bacterium]
LSVAYYGDCKRPATITTAAERTAFERETLARIRALDSTPMGYGQYDLTEYVSGEKARFTANADYWRAQPSTGFFEIQVVPMGREVDAVLDGTVDIVRAYSTIKVVDSVYKSGFVSIYSWMGDVVGYLGMQASCPLFTDLRVRQALAMGIDRQQVVTNTLERYGTLPGMLLFDSFAETSDVLGEKDPLDRIRANALLDEAGWTRGTDGVRVKDGQRFAFTFVATKENPVTEAMAAGLQLCATQLGLEIKMEWVPFDELCRRVETGDCDMYFEARHLPTHPALAADLFVGESPLNHSGYTSEGMERFTNWAAREKDEARQSVIYEGMYQEMYLELPFIPIYRRADLLLVNGRVRNLYISSAHAITSDAYRFIIRDAKTDDE